MPFVDAQELVSAVLPDQYEVFTKQAYMSVYHATTGPGDDNGVTLTQLREPMVFELHSPRLTPQLIVTGYGICSVNHPDEHGLLISGQLHIRIPSRQKGVTIATKKRLTKQAFEILERSTSKVFSM